MRTSSIDPHTLPPTRYRSVPFGALLLALAALACGASDDPPSVDAGPASLIGTWRRVSNALEVGGVTPEAERQHAVFDGNGLMTLWTPSETRFYDYTTDGHELSWRRRGVPNPQLQVTPYLIVGDRFRDELTYPEGAVTDVVGVWVTRLRYAGDDIERRWTFNASGSGLVAVSRAGNTSSYTLTWRVLGEDVRVIVAVDEVTSDVVYFALRDGVLVAEYEAVAPISL